MKRKINNPYVKEKFDECISGLLNCSYRTKNVEFCFFILFRLNEKDFSDKQKPLWNEIVAILTSEEPTYDIKGEPIVGQIENSLNSLNEIQYSNLMEKLLSLYFSLKGYDGYQKPL